MRFTVVLSLALLASICLAQSVEELDTNGDGVVNEYEEPILPKLLATTTITERKNKLVDGIYVNVSEIQDFHRSFLQVKSGKFTFFLFSCQGGTSEDGAIQFEQGWFRAAEKYWHPGEMNGRAILWRDDAWRCWRRENRLYDYGILVRVEGNDPKLALKNTPSVTTLYDSKMKPVVGEWRDPFVYGARKMVGHEKAEQSDATERRSPAN
jgi:hypothetical protein